MLIEGGEAFFNEIMVVIIPGVAGDAVAAGMAGRERAATGIVVEGEADEGAAAGEDDARIGAAGGIPGEPFHFAMAAIGEPGVEGGGVGGSAGGGDATIIEAEITCDLLHAGGGGDHAERVKK